MCPSVPSGPRPPRQAEADPNPQAIRPVPAEPGGDPPPFVIRYDAGLLSVHRLRCRTVCRHAGAFDACAADRSGPAGGSRSAGSGLRAARWRDCPPAGGTKAFVNSMTRKPDQNQYKFALEPIRFSYQFACPALRAFAGGSGGSAAGKGSAKAKRPGARGAPGPERLRGATDQAASVCSPSSSSAGAAAALRLADLARFCSICRIASVSEHLLTAAISRDMRSRAAS